MRVGELRQRAELLQEGAEAQDGAVDALPDPSKETGAFPAHALVPL